MVSLSESSIARKVLAPPRSWLLRACRRRNSFSASSPQSKASRLWRLETASSCHTAGFIAAWGVFWRQQSVLHSVPAGSPANPIPVSYPFRRASLVRLFQSRSWQHARHVAKRNRLNRYVAMPPHAEAESSLRGESVGTSGCYLQQLFLASRPPTCTH